MADSLQNSVRKCGSDFKYCNGRCTECTINRITTSNSSSSEKKD